MKKNTFPLRLILVIVGAVVIGTVTALVMPDYLKDSWRHIFIYISVALVYCAWALPLLVMGTSTPGGSFWATAAVYWAGQSVFTGISVWLIKATVTGVLPMKLTFGIELAAAFILVIYIFMAIRTHIQHENVREEEAEKTAYLSELKNKSGMLNARITSTPGVSEEAKAALAQFEKDIRYMSPTDSPQAVQLEKQMLAIINYLNDSGILARDSEQTTEIVNRQLQELAILCRQRKMIYQE